MGGRPAWPRCPHTWLAGLDAHGLEASGEDGGVGHIGIQAFLLAPIDQDHHDEQQRQTQGHRHHADVERHILGPAHCYNRRTKKRRKLITARRRRRKKRSPQVSGNTCVCFCHILHYPLCKGVTMRIYLTA